MQGVFAAVPAALTRREHVMYGLFHASLSENSTASFDFATLRVATLRTNGCDSLSPFVLSVAERQRSEVEGQFGYSDTLLAAGNVQDSRRGRPAGGP